MYTAESYDVAVIGAGHAGIEAALACARLGCKTIIFTINMDSVGNLPCNPAIGGTAKGHLVFEIDALGGEMGKAADCCTIQSRMLNLGKGPAVHSLRAQVDRRKYSEYMKQVLENQENLLLRQAEVTGLSRDGEDWLVYTRLGAVHRVKCVIIASGTYLGGKIYVGEVSYSGGPDGMFAADSLSESLLKLNIPLRRFKTGTPARVLSSSVDYSSLQKQEGDAEITTFSTEYEGKVENKRCCYVSWTNERTKDVILSNLDRSPLYSGKIDGVGPRYCPSIEDKIVRFPDKERHQCFIEPCGLSTSEMYLQGMSSSLPEEVQLAIYRTMDGLANVQMMRSAYAIEYDCVDPTELNPTLEFKKLSGLYGAGQFNGSSGYEEAAAQGIIAGINAAMKVLGREPVVLERCSSYIGTLIDDLVTCGVTDPYRMMTSRSEYRLILRQDNADERLTPIGYSIGLVGQDKYDLFLHNKELKEKEIKRAKSTTIPSSDELNALLTANGTNPLSGGARLADLLKRPGITYDLLSPFDTSRPDIPKKIMERAEVEIRYEGYIARQNAQIEEQKRLEKRLLPQNIDYREILGLRLEASEKLNRYKPMYLGQASRISGVSPADISVLLIWLSKNSDGGAAE